MLKVKVVEAKDKEKDNKKKISQLTNMSGEIFIYKKGPFC